MNQSLDNERIERSDPILATSQEPAQRRRSETEIYKRAEQERRRADRVRRRERAAETGGVYFIEAVGLKKVKIGYASDVQSRLSKLACSSPVPLRLVAFIRGPRDLEFTMHCRFQASHSHREWFNLGKRLAAFIEEGSAQKAAHGKAIP